MALKGSRSTAWEELTTSSQHWEERQEDPKIKVTIGSIEPADCLDCMKPCYLNNNERERERPNHVRPSPFLPPSVSGFVKTTHLLGAALQFLSFQRLGGTTDFLQILLINSNLLTGNSRKYFCYLMWAM